MEQERRSVAETQVEVEETVAETQVEVEETQVEVEKRTNKQKITLHWVNCACYDCDCMCSVVGGKWGVMDSRKIHCC
jgi:hypothetical protein